MTAFQGKGCAIYHKGSRFYADWRDSYGVRRRKAFLRKSDALAFEKEKKSEHRKRRKTVKSSKMMAVTSRFSVETMNALEEVASLTGFASQRDLISAYVMQGLKGDLIRIDGFLLPALAESLHKRGIEEETVSSVLAEVKSRRKPLYSRVDAVGGEP